MSTPRKLAAAVLITLAVVFALRRLAGALVVPLHPLALLAFGIAVTVATLAVRRAMGVPRSVPFETALSIALIVTLCSLALPGTAPLAILGLVMMTLAEETRAWTTLPFSVTICMRQPFSRDAQRARAVRRDKTDAT